MKTIEQAVNRVLENLNIAENQAFIEMMTALYERINDIQDIEESMSPDAFEAINEVTNAIGEFVPS